jgi:hypothetical protein
MTTSGNELLTAYSHQAGDVTRFRRDIEEIVRSYRHSWDVFAELIQNAVDAIRRRARSDTNFDSGQLIIRVDPVKQQITIIDDGEGMIATDMLRALAPGQSLKQMGTDYGYKGFGLTFVLYASSVLRIRSVKDGLASTLVVTGALDWLASGEVEEATLPIVQWVERDVETGESNGTEVTVTLDSGSYQTKYRPISALDGMFEWAQNPRALEYVLRLRTAVGNTLGLFGESPAPEVDVTAFVGDHPSVTIPYLYLLAGESTYVAAKYFETVPEYLKVYEDGGLSRDAKAYRGLGHRLVDRSVGTVAPVSYRAAILICGKTGMSKMAAEFGVTSDLANYSELLLSTSVQLALGGMPLGIAIESWENFGHDMARYFVLIDADLGISDQLDSGRKGISRYFANAMVADLLAALREKKFGGQNHSLMRLSQMMTEPDSGSTNVTQLAERVAERRSAGAPLSAGGILQFEPEDENEVILLFGHLVAEGTLPGYRAILISQGTTYDAAMEFSLRRDHPNFSYLQHPLGLGLRAQEIAEASADDEYKWLDTKGVEWFVVEFKPKLQDLIVSKKQRLSEIDLVVCWDFDAGWLDSHAATLEPVRPDTRSLYGVTHRLSYDGDTCDVIVLSRAIEADVAARTD